MVSKQERLLCGVNTGRLGRTMYWTDAQRGVIESSALDGSARAVLIDERRSTLQANNNKSTSVVRPHYYGIALDQRYLYYTDWSRGSVCTLHTHRYLPYRKRNYNPHQQHTRQMSNHSNCRH